MEAIYYLIPLGVIGIWRWTIWLIKRVIASFYRPVINRYKSAVSIVTPVYNEDPKIFKTALLSWKANKPDEIIAVIDYTDKKCIKVFDKFSSKFLNAKLIITKKPGKRPALADGIRVAKSPVVALVDCDTIWDVDTLRHGIMPFKDKKVAAVATKQSVLKPKSIAQRLFSIRLEQRYWDDIPFLSMTVNRLQCVSGRTGFYRIKVIKPMLKDFVDEFFWGKRVISGEDKRLTYLVEARGHKVKFQSSSQVYTNGAYEFSTYLKQQIRWIRNSWRADLGALKSAWVFRYPVLAFYLIDRAIQPFTLILSPIFFATSLLLGLWQAAILIVIWWHLSRAIKMFPHLKKYPLDIFILPIYVVYSFTHAYYKVFSLLTLNTQGWITRWHKSRLTKMPTYRFAFAHAVTIAIVVITGQQVYTTEKRLYLAPIQKQKVLMSQAFTQSTKNYLAQIPTEENILGATAPVKQDLLVKRHVVQPGQTVNSIAYQYNVPVDQLIYANAGHLAYGTYFYAPVPTVGTAISIPPTDFEFVPDFSFYEDASKYPYFYIEADADKGPVRIFGNQSVVTLTTIHDYVGDSALKEVSPKIWELYRPLELYSGTTLRLDSSEVEWLRLISRQDVITSIKGFDTVIEIRNTKITSWDDTEKDYDYNHLDGRSYIVVKDASRIDIYNSEIAYLGYSRPLEHPFSTYGISWRMSTGKLKTTLLSGEVIDSKFHHNYFGAYTYGATGMVWRGNEFYDNVRYGLDPHDDSTGFLVEYNISHDNGTHGIILSKRCLYNTIRNNISYNNGSHGIMLHEQSNFNIIDNNDLYGNIDGIALHSSHKNIIRNNNIYENIIGVRGYFSSTNNDLSDNIISDNLQYGIYLYDKSDANYVHNNLLSKNRFALYIKANGNNLSENTIEANSIGIYLLEKSNNNYLANNDLKLNINYGIYSKVPVVLQNILSENDFEENNMNTYIWDK
ncbi:hypothetical protein A3A93_00900 [Candidatus Roizmanbacteria bacterium RIFCSPLOWO2_01_FULL_38_12]|uniref:LysM domain-containing protein n=1 Tax=Candidatus Roizmanbacteria bacterium RIFCSPLOWO2_01_FULL_38_12 TaxID=1802061 RepID=A0A1F7IR52_9BACT|nr:MAG: hypothetical protein A3F59_05480 [Candidatus Roizmanbacteria bacterium RIFCSPHIGHO2_12_FULL_38_13]OGK45844.1 MAG: hypothetical protein A3A93_00900 [Candidatus Roizmanbacteria bacterium RIFCSPLOWO2_01_FULL_38_12]